MSTWCQPRVNLGSTWGQPGVVTLHRPTTVMVNSVELLQQGTYYVHFLAQPEQFWSPEPPNVSHRKIM